MRRTFNLFLFFVMLIVLNNVSAQKKLKPSFFGSMKARSIGPAIMSGRITSLDASKKNPNLVYIGAASGGIWKTTNGGTTFKPVFEKQIQTIGALAIDQQHNDTVWAGTGEAWTRNSISVGKGLFKTTNAGEDWKLLGLENTRHISKIVINPNNSNVVFVAALGNVWKPNKARGVFKTEDGGKTWRKVLFVDENTGCSDLAMDPQNPKLIFAGMWDYQRKPYTFRSGGSGSGLYKSIDGGRNWKKVKMKLPNGNLGRISVAFSEADPNIIYALIESKKTGLYRSLDRGKTWELRTTSQFISERPFYFSNIFPDPIDTNKVYKPGFSLYVSDDGGYSFSSPFVEGGNVHSDLHAFWIDPNNNRHLYLGTDGGFYVSYDRGSTWSHAQNLPISQFYHISVDNEEPYNVYGGLQDNGSWVGPSESVGGISNCDWKNVGYGDGFNVLPDPTDKNILYWQYQGGNLMRFYKSTKEIKEVKPFSENPKEKLRFNWDTPIEFSPTQKGVLYVGSQFLYRTKNRGDSWEKISPDLTTNDPEKQKQEESGGLTIDNSTAENHCTIYTISESPINSKSIWVGTDDGNLYVTNNDGEIWTNVVTNIPDLPQNTWCSSVFTSNFDKNKAYVVFDGHRNGDGKAYVYKTSDLGKTWRSISNQSIEGFARVILQDNVNPNLMFLGTEYGLYISLDDGENWVRFKSNLPKVPIYDMAIQSRKSDLVLATHGRGVMIIDDISPLRQLTADVINSDVYIFPSKPYTITNPKFAYGISGDQEFSGDNPSSAAIITYYLKKRHIFGDMSIEIYNAKNELVKTLPTGKNKGINRVKWVIRKKPPKVKASSPLLAFRTAFGPTFPPGKYAIKLKKNGKEYFGSITLQTDSKSGHSPEDMKVQYRLLTKAYKLLEDISFNDKQLTTVYSDLKDESKKIDGGKNEDLNSFLENLNRIHKNLVSTSLSRISGQIRLAEKVGDIYSGIINYLGKPTKSQIERLDLLNTEFDKYKVKIKDLLQTELAKINSILRKNNLKELKILSREEYDKS